MGAAGVAPLDWSCPGPVFCNLVRRLRGWLGAETWQWEGCGHIKQSPWLAVHPRTEPWLTGHTGRLAPVMDAGSWGPSVMRDRAGFTATMQQPVSWLMLCQEMQLVRKILIYKSKSSFEITHNSHVSCFMGFYGLVHLLVSPRGEKSSLPARSNWPSVCS